MVYFFGISNYIKYIIFAKIFNYMNRVRFPFISEFRFHAKMYSVNWSSFRIKTGLSPQDFSWIDERVFLTYF